jgi:hypothetical protein
VEKLSSVNRRILDTIEESKFPDDVKALLKALLAIELKNFGDKSPRYGEDYDRILKQLAKVKGFQEDE